MTTHQDTSRFRGPFIGALVVSMVLFAVVLVLAWRLRQAPKAPAAAVGGAAAAGQVGAAAEPQSLPVNAALTQPPLSPVQMTPQRMQSIGVQIGHATLASVHDELRLQANVQIDERRVVYVQSRVTGWIREVYVDETGARVREGQPLLTMYSPDLAATEREYLLAKKNAADLAHSSVDGVAAGADALLRAAQERLAQWGVPQEEMQRLDRTGQASDTIPILSPAGGFVTDKNAVPNQYVQPDTKMYMIADLSDVWVVAQVFQNDAGKVAPGDRADITVDAFPGTTFSGRVDDVLPQVDPSTRTVAVRLLFSNKSLKLRPGMYANVVVNLPLGRQLVVPTSAVLHSGTRNLVFVYDSNGQITPREIEAGPQIGAQQIVLKGLASGDAIVASAAFLIDSEAQLQAAAGTFAPPPPGAGAAASVNRPTSAQATIDVTTDPSPPHKGHNTVRIRLVGPDGRGIGGAQVTVTFFMAAMPAMGMPALKTVVTPADKGGGMYEGAGDLGSGGAWQVMVAATKDGTSIGSRQLSVTATGGM